MEHRDLNNLIALAVAQQLFLFQFRNHMGVEVRYHLMLRLMVFVSLITTLLGIFTTGTVHSSKRYKTITNPKDIK